MARHPPEDPVSTVDAVHYGPGDRPICGAESWVAVHTNNPLDVTGCDDCLELVAEDLGDPNVYRGHCLHCKEVIIAVGGVGWRQVVRMPCPYCGESGW